MTDLERARLSYDIQKLIPHFRHSKRVCNLQCGDGRHIKLLNDIYSFESVFVTDTQENVFRVLMETPMNFTGYHYDLSKEIPSEIENCDTVFWIFNENSTIDQLRAVCTYSLNKKLVLMIEYCYMNDIIKICFPNHKSERIYPNSLEVDGSRHYLIVAE